MVEGGGAGRSTVDTLTLAIGAYDHVRDLSPESTRDVGADLSFVHLSAPEIFSRFSRERSWDIAEMSLGMYVAMLTRGETWLTAIPVFPSRMFRHSAIFVRRNGSIRAPQDLAGGRIGFPDWTHTAGIWARALLQHQYGVSLESVTWVQAGMDKPGFVSRAGSDLPPHLRFEPRQDATLDALLVDGGIDAIISAHTPPSAKGENAPLVRLFPDSVAIEESYFRETGVFPIMHVVAVQAAVAERLPNLLPRLLSAFTAAKDNSLRRMSDAMVSPYALPWMFQHAETARSVFGDDYWPYGVAANRPTLKAFLRYAEEQGVAARSVTVEELFPASVLAS